MSSRELENNNPGISKRAFWDIDFNSIEWNKNTKYLITKVLHHGSFDDVLKLINYYGDDYIKQNLLEADSLPESIYYFALTYFNLDNSDFKCSITKL